MREFGGQHLQCNELEDTLHCGTQCRFGTTFMHVGPTSAGCSSVPIRFNTAFNCTDLYKSANPSAPGVFSLALLWVLEMLSSRFRFVLVAGKGTLAENKGSA
jgi:hypothetical protein